MTASFAMADGALSGYRDLRVTHPNLLDVTLVLKGGETLRTHRLVLADCSGFFAAVFAKDGGTSSPNINLPDADPAAVKELINMIYGGFIKVKTFERGEGGRAAAGRLRHEGRDEPRDRRLLYRLKMLKGVTRRTE